jgi:triosephosphate isomerase
MDKILVLNWKMQPEKLNSCFNFFKKLNKIVNKKYRKKIYVAPPSIYAINLKRKFKDYNIGLQNAFYEKTGAFTGEISLSMIKKNGLDFVILGHSERRVIFKENLNLIFKKIKESLNLKIKTIYCFEKISEIKKFYKTEEFKNFINQNLKNYLYLAYEPRSAISTFGGKEIKIEKVKKVKKIVNNLFPGIKLLYGGSINEKNILNYIELDGFLVGIKSFKINFVKKILKFIFHQ